MPATISPEIAHHWQDTPVFVAAISDALLERERDKAALFNAVDDWDTYAEGKGLLNGPYIHGDNPYSHKFDNIRVLRERFPGQVAIRPPLHGPYSESCVYTTPDLAAGAAMLVGQRVERRPPMATLVHNDGDYTGPEHAYENFHTFISDGLMFSPDESHFGAYVEALVPEGYILDGSDDRLMIAKRALMRSVIQNATRQIETGTKKIDPERDYLPTLRCRHSFEQYIADEILPMTAEHLQTLGHLTAEVRVNHLFPASQC